MAKVIIKDLEIGMCLAADVCDLNGRFLIGADCELTDKHIKALNAWGVASVEINDADIELEQVENSISNEDFERKQNELKESFIHNDLAHPFISELITEASRYLLSKVDNK